MLRGRHCDWSANLYVNDNTGTIVTGGADVEPLQLNLGSNKPLGATVKGGGQGHTFGGPAAESKLTSGTPNELTVRVDSIVVPPGSSLGVSVIPPTGNTSVNVDIEVSIIRLTED